MVTTIIKTINPNGFADYTTLQAWADDRKGNLVTRDTIEVAEVMSGIYTDGLTLLAADWTVDSTHYIIVRAKADNDHPGVFDPSKAYLSLQSEIDIQVGYTRFGQGLCIYPNLDINNPGAIHIRNISVDAPVIIDRIIIHKYGNNFPAIFIENCSGATGHVIKSSIVQNGTGGMTCIRADGASTKVAVYNCTLNSDSVTLRASNAATITEDNNYLAANGGTIYHTFTGAGVINKGTHTMTDDTSATTAGNRNVALSSTNFIFPNPSGAGWHESQIGISDWHIPSTSALKGAGADLSGISPSTFAPTLGIDSQTRTIWDIGADEYTTPTTITSDVGPGKTYTTFADFITAKKGNLAVRDTIEVAQIWGSTGPVDMEDVDWGTNNKNYVQIKAAPGKAHNGVFSTAGAYIKAADGSSGTGVALKCHVGGTMIGPGLVIDADAAHTGVGSMIVIEIGGQSSAPFIVDGVIGRVTDVGGDWAPTLLKGVSLINYTKQSDGVTYLQRHAIIKSCALYANGSEYGMGQTGGGAWKFYNNTIYIRSGSNGTIFNGSNDGFCSDQNCYLASKIVYNVGSSWTKGANTATSTSEAATAIYRNVALNSAGFMNVTAGSENFHLTNGSVLIDQGADLTAQGVTTDFEGEPRPGSPAFDIGADEFQHIPVCWNYTARYKGSNKLYKASGCGSFPKTLRVPNNVDVSTGRMIDDGIEIDPRDYRIV